MPEPKVLDLSKIIGDTLEGHRMKKGPSNYDPEKKKAKFFGFHGSEEVTDGADREGEIPDREGEGRDTTVDS